MTDRTKSAIQFWGGLGTLLVTLTLTWARLNAQVDQLQVQKADRTELHEIEKLLTRIDERTADLWDAACTSQPRQLGCRRPPGRP